MAELMQNQVGLTEFSWNESYGDIIKFRGPFGRDRLLISDPKALQHIFKTYRWDKPPEHREIARMVAGKGLAWANGDSHKRQRKIVLPGFNGCETRNFLPLFFSCAASMAERWTDIIASSEDQFHVFNVPAWVSRAALDAIGRAAFNYNFGAIEQLDNELARAYQNLPMKVFGAPSKTALVMLELYSLIPQPFLEFLNDNNPSPRVAHARHVAQTADAAAQQLISDRTNTLLKGESKNDVITLLVKANASQNPKEQLTREELISQMRGIILAGHETTSNTLSWLFYELVRSTQLQDELRAEIRTVKKRVVSRGDRELSIHDLESMPLLGATIKETLRFHPVVMNVFRTAQEDDVVPLSRSITTKDGEVLTELPVPKGTRAVLSIAVYNRNKTIFGHDAHTFNPYRWLEADHVKKDVALGPFANLATFSAGTRLCIGWRFAVMEMQAFIIELLNTFEFSKTPKIERIRREAAFGMVPTVDGELENGAQLPLKVAFAPKDE